MSESKVGIKAALIERLRRLRSTKAGVSYSVRENAARTVVTVVTESGAKAEFSSKSNSIENLRDLVETVEETLLKTSFIERKA